VGITAVSTETAAEQLRQAHRLGATAALVALPTYFELPFVEVKRHYQRLVELDLLEVLYYHYPAATHLDLTPPQVGELLAIPGVVGIKETTFDMRAVEEHGSLSRGRGTRLLSGSELNYVAFMKLGGHGAISAGALVMPRTAAAMHAAYSSGDRHRARELQAQLFETLPLLKHTSAPVSIARRALQAALRAPVPLVPLGADTTVARLKAALGHRGVPIHPRVRSPQPQLDARGLEAVEKAMARIEKIEPTSRP
jgi:4-hydroxy-tetrahydrodipicolinate synthase